MKNNCLSAAILAGGKNSRMHGENKAFIQIQGSTILQRVITELGSVFEEIILVANNASHYEGYQKDARIVTDIIKGAGPLGGIHSALSYAKNNAVFLAACDMPFLDRDIILKVADAFNNSDYDVLLSRIGDKIEPLCAVYKCFLKDKIQNYIMNGSNLSVRGFLENTKDIQVGYIGFEGDDFHRRVFKNINTPEEARGV